MTRTLLLTAATLALAGGGRLASANPSWVRTLDPGTKATAHADYVKYLKEQGEDLSLADVRLSFDVVATSNDGGCPGLDVDVINATKRPAFYVTVQIDQSLGGRKRSDVVHLPYLPAQTQAKVTVSCIEDYTYKSRYSYGADTSEPISFEYTAKSERDVASALRQLIAHKADAELGYTIKPSPSGHTLLEQVFAENDATTARDLVAAIAQTGVGAKELGDAMAKGKTSSNAFADEVAAQLATLPAAQQGKLARVLLATPQAAQWAPKLVPLIDGKLCAGARGDAVALWMLANDPAHPDAITDAALRDRVRARCTLQPTDGAALALAVGEQAANAAALDKVDAAMFAGAVAQWKKVKGGPGAIAYLAATGDAARFDAAVATLGTADDTFDAILAIAQGQPAAEAAAAGEHKAAWLAAAIAKSPDQKDLVKDLFGKYVDGRITDPAMRQAVRKLRDLDPATVDSTIAKFASEHSKVYDAEKLADAKVDMLDFLAFATTSLLDCSNTLDTLDACAQAIAKRPDLVKASKALRTEFSSSVDQLLANAGRDYGDKTRYVAVAQHVAAAGISVQREIDRQCSEVRDALRWGGNYDRPLEIVKQLPGGETCVAEVADQAASKHRTAIIMTVLSILGLILPIAAGAWFVRRRWRQFLAKLPKVEEADANAGARLDDRLGAAGLGNALAGALGEARREVGLPELGAGLAALDPAMIERAAGTVRRAVKTGDAASLLARAPDGRATYVLALPVTHARPQVVQRYLGAEWVEHLDGVVAAAGAPVTALVVLCDPSATEATLLVGYAAPDGRRSDPDALLDAKEARERDANTFRGAMSLRVAAPAPAAAPTPAGA